MDCLRNIFEKRRSIYNIGNKIHITDTELKNIIEKAIQDVPSAFNSQSSRVVLLLKDNHVKLWNEITLNILKDIIPDKTFETTKNKIQSFANGYGTILFYEDISTINQLEKNFPKYKENFSVWSNQTNAMLQYMIWTLFTEKDIGANLQHYNPLIDKDVMENFKIDKNWKLIAQMPFGNILKPADAKDFSNTKEKFKIL